MNQPRDPDLEKFFAAARPPRDTARVELGFETRLLARIRAEKQSAAAIPWFYWAWRLTPIFAAIVLVLGVWTMAGSGSPGLADWPAALATDQAPQEFISTLTGD